MDKKKVIISAINFFEGGPLSVLRDCLWFLNNSHYQTDYKFIALVHKRDLFDQEEYQNIEFIEFPKSRKSYIFRLHYEYWHFKKIAKQVNVYFWLSLHDISPSLNDNIKQAVYCHNPSPFNSINFKDIYLQPTQFFFRLFYKFLYQINIKKNTYVIVQQQWLREKFAEIFKLDRGKIIVATPQIEAVPLKYLKAKEDKKAVKQFFFPTFPRPFKNIEVICEAVMKLAKNDNDFQVTITIDGTENNYAKSIVDKFGHIKNLKFIGLINRNEVYKFYSLTDVLIFPSKLETWGLPISEFKQFNKPIFVSDLPYAKETVGDYAFAKFFNPNDANELSLLMAGFLKSEIAYDVSLPKVINNPYAKDWNELFEKLLD